LWALDPHNSPARRDYDIQPMDRKSRFRKIKILIKLKKIQTLPKEMHPTSGKQQSRNLISHLS